MELLHKSKTWELIGEIASGKEGCWPQMGVFGVILAMVNIYDVELKLLDSKTTFHEDLAEQNYMQQPEGFKEPRKEEYNDC